jgi:hypothetical protein
LGEILFGGWLELLLLLQTVLFLVVVFVVPEMGEQLSDPFFKSDLLLLNTFKMQIQAEQDRCLHSQVQPQNECFYTVYYFFSRFVLFWGLQ